MCCLSENRGELAWQAANVQTPPPTLHPPPPAKYTGQRVPCWGSGSACGSPWGSVICITERNEKEKNRGETRQAPAFRPDLHFFVWFSKVVFLKTNFTALSETGGRFKYGRKCSSVWLSAYAQHTSGSLGLWPSGSSDPWLWFPLVFKDGAFPSTHGAGWAGPTAWPWAEGLQVPHSRQ